jgi:hypothetical protein
LILAGGFLANFNGLNVLILRVRILVLVPFLLVAFGGLSDSFLRHAVALGLLAQLLSIFSIFISLGLHLERVRIPRILARVPRSTRALGLVAILGDLLLFAGYLIMQVRS